MFLFSYTVKKVEVGKEKFERLSPMGLLLASISKVVQNLGEKRDY